MQCNVCESAIDDVLYASESERALTSLCEFRDGRVRVWSCHRCGHLQGSELVDTAAFYEDEYRILLDHEDEDQIYEVKGDQVVYRTDHQAATLIGKIGLSDSALVLDYGCAKAAMPKRLLRDRPDLQVHLFDVSSMYRPYWDKLVPAARQSTYSTPAAWDAKFDVVTSFFALEHIPAPRNTLSHIVRLLKDAGTFYGVVPDTFGNVADFVVIDHVNHFTKPSLEWLLSEAGLFNIEIDDQVHRGALVFSATKGGAKKPALPPPTQTLQRSGSLATYWTEINQRIRSAEAMTAGASAIYGSGFYGAYILSTLQQPERLRCFVDRSPFRQGKELFGRPILAPLDFPADIETLYVGLNPSIARETFRAAAGWMKPGVQLVFLDALDG